MESTELRCCSVVLQGEEGPAASGQVVVSGRGVRGALLHVPPAGEHRQGNWVKKITAREDEKEREREIIENLSDPSWNFFYSSL